MSTIPGAPSWRELGYTSDPFEYTDADQEELLEHYFVTPPFFHSILGDTLTPSPAVVFAPRGGGKTALRRMVENSASLETLVVRYTIFPTLDGILPEKITIEAHLKRLIADVLIGIITDVAEGILTIPDGQTARSLRSLANTYLADMDRAHLAAAIDSLQRLPDKARAFLGEWAGHVGTFLSFLWASGNGAERFPGPLKFGEDEPPLNASPLQDFRLLGEVAKKCGLTSIYVLVDRVDEDAATQSSPKAAYALVAPLLNNLGILQQPPFAFKLFLPSALRSLWEDDGGRIDRIPVFSAVWDIARLREMLDKRLAAYSRSGTAPKIEEVIAEPPLRAAILLFANGSPRDVIRILKLSTALQLNNDETMVPLGSVAIVEALDEFSLQKANEIAGRDGIERLRKIASADFTVETAARRLNVSESTARGYIRTLESRGVILRVPEREQPGAVGKPAVSYAIADLRVCRQAFPGYALHELLRRKMRPCPAFHLVIRDWDIWPEGSRHTCPVCGAQVEHEMDEEVELDE